MFYGRNTVAPADQLRYQFFNQRGLSTIRFSNNRNDRNHPAHPFVVSVFNSEWTVRVFPSPTNHENTFCFSGFTLCAMHYALSDLLSHVSKLIGPNSELYRSAGLLLFRLPSQSPDLRGRQSVRLLLPLISICQSPVPPLERPYIGYPQERPRPE
jgi:hypothetical protein